MTASDDFPRDDSSHGPPEGPVEPDAPFDEDAAWREIVENYGERPRLGESWNAPGADPDDAPSQEAGEGPRPAAPREGSVFDRSFLDSYSDEVAAEAWAHHRRHDDDHFVPPPPPPLPKGPPARRLAWLGVLVPPIVMVLAVLVRWPFPTWASFLLVVAFLGGFVFLVATMPREPREDGDDGAVV
jgi:hypothetical protein